MNELALNPSLWVSKRFAGCKDFQHAFINLDQPERGTYFNRRSKQNPVVLTTIRAGTINPERLDIVDKRGQVKRPISANPLPVVFGIEKPVFGLAPFRPMSFRRNVDDVPCTGSLPPSYRRSYSETSWPSCAFTSRIRPQAPFPGNRSRTAMLAPTWTRPVSGDSRS